MTYNLLKSVRKLRRFIRDERASVFPVIALSLPVLIGTAALAIDIGHLRVVESRLQSTADSAARAGASQLPDTDEAEATAVDMAGKNMAVEDHGTVLHSRDVIFGTWDESSRTFAAGGTPPNAIRTILRRSAANGNAVSLYLASILGISEMDVVKDAIAARLTVGTACLLTLAPNGTSITVSGDVNIQANQCGFAANSSDGSAVSSKGASANARINSLYAAGGLDDRHGVFNVSKDPQLNTGEPLPDPYADQNFDFSNEPISPTAGAKSKPNKTVNLQPGRYPDGFDFKGDVNMAAGVYVMEGDVKITAQADVNGDRVTVALMDSDLRISGNAEIDLSAPTSGDTEGMVLVRRGSHSTKSDLSGKGHLQFDGVIYMPNSEFRFSGTSANGGCLQMVAYRIEFKDEPIFHYNCAAYNIQDITQSRVALVR